MYCTACGSENPDHGTACTQCGKALVAPGPPASYSTTPLPGAPDYPYSGAQPAAGGAYPAVPPPEQAPQYGPGYAPGYAQGYAPGPPPGYPGYPTGYAMPQNVPNNLVQAILVTMFCCLPTGIASIVYASQVDTKVRMGDYLGALDSSKKANMWAWISFGLGMIVPAFYIIAAIVASIH